MVVMMGMVCGGAILVAIAAGVAVFIYTWLQERDEEA